MARLTFSALLAAASGKVGDVVFSRWKGIAYARRRVIPSNPQSGPQCKQRYVLKVSLLLWQSIKSWAKAPWTLSVSGYALSGYNKAMDDIMTALIPQFTAGGQGADADARGGLLDRRGYGQEAAQSVELRRRGGSRTACRPGGLLRAGGAGG